MPGPFVVGTSMTNRMLVSGGLVHVRVPAARRIAMTGLSIMFAPQVEGRPDDLNAFQHFLQRGWPLSLGASGPFLGNRGPVPQMG